VETQRQTDVHPKLEILKTGTLQQTEKTGDGKAGDRRKDPVTHLAELVVAAMEQVEGLSKPCLTLWSDLRDQADAIMS